MALNVPTGQPAPLRDGEYHSLSVPNVVSYDLSEIQPPSQLYLQMDDQLGILVTTSQFNTEIVTITGRFLRASDGVVVPFNFTFPMPAGSARAGKAFSLGEGYLLSVSTITNAAGFTGQTFVELFISRGNFTVAPLTSNVQMLAAQYATQNQPAAWPGGRMITSLEGPGFLTTLNPANPAAGADISVVFAGSNVQARVHSVVATFTASAAVANRVPTFFIGGNPALAVPATTAITAGQVKQFSIYEGAQPYTDGNGNFVLSMPQNSLAQATLFHLTSNTVGIQAGDQWSAVKIYEEQWCLTG